MSRGRFGSGADMSDYRTGHIADVEHHLHLQEEHFQTFSHLRFRLLSDHLLGKRCSLG